MPPAVPCSETYLSNVSRHTYHFTSPPGSAFGACPSSGRSPSFMGTPSPEMVTRICDLRRGGRLHQRREHPDKAASKRATNETPKNKDVSRHAISMSRDITTCPRQDSNLRPSVPETGALSPELRGLKIGQAISEVERALTAVNGTMVRCARKSVDGWPSGR